METTVSIRPARLEDAVKVHEFICELEETDFDYPAFLVYYEQNIAHPDHIYLVAEEAGGNPVGYLSCHGQVLLHHLGKVFEIQEMFVDEAYRGKRIGRSLIEALEKILETRDYRSLEVTTNMKRTATQEFYRNNGFLPTHLKFTREGKSINN